MTGIERILARARPMLRLVMGTMVWIGAGLSLLLFVYLGYALLRPEGFE